MRTINYLFLLVLPLLIAGCGQSGPLFLQPSPKTTTKPVKPHVPVPPHMSGNPPSMPTRTDNNLS